MRNINKVQKPTKTSTGTFVLAGIPSLTLDFYLCFICNRSLRHKMHFQNQEGRKGRKKRSCQGWWEPQIPTGHSEKPQCPRGISSFSFLREYLGLQALLETHRFGFQWFPGSFYIPYLAKRVKCPHAGSVKQNMWGMSDPLCRHLRPEGNTAESVTCQGTPLNQLRV